MKPQFKETPDKLKFHQLFRQSVNLEATSLTKTRLAPRLAHLILNCFAAITANICSVAITDDNNNVKIKTCYWQERLLENMKQNSILFATGASTVKTHHSV